MTKRKRFWKINKIMGYCSICGEDIHELSWIDHPEVTVERWNCKHKETVTVIIPKKEESINE